MHGPSRPRHQGKITSWKDDQGYGFIAPNAGGDEVFVHIKSFSSQRRRRPALNEIVTYELTVNDKGQPRAGNVAFVRARTSSQPSRPTGTAPLYPVYLAAVFLGMMAVAVLAGRLPLPVFGLYLVASALTFVVYALDKHAARHDRWRTRESTLHLLSLVGGWPGALCAQRILRHKSKKASFQVAFWLTVAVNCGVLVWLVSPAGSEALRMLPQA